MGSEQGSDAAVRFYVLDAVATLNERFRERDSDEEIERLARNALAVLGAQHMDTLPVSVRSVSGYGDWRLQVSRLTRGRERAA